MQLKCFSGCKSRFDLKDKQTVFFQQKSSRFLSQFGVIKNLFGLNKLERLSPSGFSSLVYQLPASQRLQVIMRLFGLKNIFNV